LCHVIFVIHIVQVLSTLYCVHVLCMRFVKFLLCTAGLYISCMWSIHSMLCRLYVIYTYHAYLCKVCYFIHIMQVLQTICYSYIFCIFCKVCYSYILRLFCKLYAIFTYMPCVFCKLYNTYTFYVGIM